jgi:hypothetical protein
MPIEHHRTARGRMTQEELRAEIEIRLQYLSPRRPAAGRPPKDSRKRPAETGTLESLYRRLGLNG